MNSFTTSSPSADATWENSRSHNQANWDERAAAHAGEAVVVYGD